MFGLPFTLPAVDPTTTSSGGGGGTEIDVGGYDILIGGHGFRLATDQQFPYERATEETTARRVDSSLEVGEQSLAQLPWIKSQSSFHGGAGQLNLELGYTAFQYQQEQVQHIRFDASYGVNVWTPGEVKRLPDCLVLPHVGSQLTLGKGMTVTGTDGTTDFAVMVANTFQQLSWSSGPDSLPVATNIDLSGADFGGASNCKVISLDTDGTNYYASIALTTAVAGVNGYVVKGSLGSAAAPTVLYDTGTKTGIVAWVKARLIACLGQSLYELSPNATAHSVLPAVKYTHPVTSWKWVACAESPNGILVAGTIGGQSSILELTLDTAGATPTLTGGATVGSLPNGEQICALESVIGSFLAIGTTAGVRIGTFDTYTGALRIGALSVLTKHPVYAMTSRDRFVYAGYSNNQEDASTGLVRVDLSMVVDSAGRNAYAADIRPPTTALFRTGNVYGVGQLPLSGRIVCVSSRSMLIEGNGPGSDGDAWIRTSRIRYATSERKLFKFGHIHGTLDVSELSVVGIVPYVDSVFNLGLFGFTTNGDPGDFALPDGLHEWLQLQFSLIGSACTFNGYHVKALPAPAAQELITLTMNCFSNEVDKYGLDVTDPETPRQRYTNVRNLKDAGDEVHFVEFTNLGSQTERVVIDQLAFRSYSRPNIDNDFGGYITLRLRRTE